LTILDIFFIIHGLSKPINYMALMKEMVPMIAGDIYRYAFGNSLSKLKPRINSLVKTDNLFLMHPELQWGYLTQDSRFYLEKIKQLLQPGGNNPKSRGLEANYYEMAIQISQRDYNRWPIHTRDQMILRGDVDNEGRPIALIDEQALSHEGNFIEVLLKQRLEAHKKYKNVIEKLASAETFTSPHLAKFLKRAKNILIPVFIIDVPSKTKPIINPVTGVKEDDSFQTFFKQALAEVAYWSASEHVIFIDGEMQNHNYCNYVRNEAARSGESIENILFRSNLHEFLHIVVDEITNRRFNRYNTWLNEGFCEYFANNMGANTELTTIQVKKTREEIMQNDEFDEKYIHGARLLWAIGKAYNAEDPDLGIWEFLVKIFGDGKPCSISLTDEVNRILEVDGKTEIVDGFL
jgi:hypothetical protein